MDLVEKTMISEHAKTLCDRQGTGLDCMLKNKNLDQLRDM